MGEKKDYNKILKQMLKADNSFDRLQYETDKEMIEFILRCEKVYRRSTKDHLTYFLKNGLEGNVDEERWYRFITYLLDKESDKKISDILGEVKDDSEI